MREKRAERVQEAPKSAAPAERVAEAKSVEPRPVVKERAAPAPVEEVAPSKPARGDDRLDALMDGALCGKGKASAVGASDDPIFGL